MRARGDALSLTNMTSFCRKVGVDLISSEVLPFRVC
jgi:hypothetical protein